MLRKLITAGIVAVFAVTTTANADLIVDTLPANNQANMTADSGQTFTTGTLLQTLLSTIEIEGPQAGGGGIVYTLELWSDTDGNHATWDPSARLATSSNSSVIDDGVVTVFQFNNVNLADNTVYAFTYTDGAGTRINSRQGLTNASAIPDGTLFSAGGQVFSDAFDTAMRITTIPEPSAAGLVLLGGMTLGLARKRRG